MGNRIIFATGNQGKMREIKAVLSDLKLEVISAKEAGFNSEVEENGKTFEQNAKIKAQFVWNQCKGVVLADDSGLEIDFLDGEPGVYSSRYMGEDTSYELKNKNILERLTSACGSQRSARFVCVISAILPDGRILTTKGTLEGQIAEFAAGKSGFGYDPIFFIPTYGKTCAEISLEEKNKISHRAKALEQMKKLLQEVYKGEGE